MSSIFDPGPRERMMALAAEYKAIADRVFDGEIGSGK